MSNFVSEIWQLKISVFKLTISFFRLFKEETEQVFTAESVHPLGTILLCIL